MLPPTTPERAPARRVVDPEPVPHSLAWVRTLQGSAPLARSMRMPEIAVGPTNGMLLQVAGERMTAAPLVGVKPPNSGVVDPQAASEIKKIAGARLFIGLLFAAASR